MIRALLLLLLIGTAFGQSVFVKDPATADSLGASATVINTTGATFTRTTSAYNPTTDTIVGPDVRRTKVAVVGTTSYNMDLIETTRTNLLAAGSSGRFELWTAVAGGTTTADTVAAVDTEVIGQTLTDPGASLSGVSQTFTVANDSLTHVFSIYVLKTAGGTAPTWGTTLALTGGTPVTTNSRINTDTGTQQYGSNASTTIEIPTNTAWYRIITTVLNNTSGNTTLTLSLYPAAAAYGASVDDAAATGTAKVCFADLNKAPFADATVSNRNLLVQTQTLNTTWTKTDITITSDSTANPIDGATNADTATEGSAGTAGLTQTPTIVAGSTLTWSAYFKRGNTDFIRFQCASTSTNGFRCWANLNAGTIGTAALMGTGTYVSSAITSLGSGWYRVSITGTVAAASTAPIVFVSSASADASTTRVNGATWIAWGTQLVYGATTQNYWAVVGANGTKTVDTLTNSLTSISDARTNRLTYSEQFDNAAWTKTDNTITANTGTDPNGYTFCDLNTEGVAGTATTSQVGANITAGQTVTYSEYVKAGTVTWVLLTELNGSDKLSGWFNVSTGVVGSVANAGTASGAAVAITNLQNGWYRCALSGIVNAGSTAVTLAYQSASADASTTRLASATYTTFGAQFEQAATAGTYLPVAGTAVSAAQTGLSTTSGTIIGVFRPYGWTGFTGSAGTAAALMSIASQIALTFPNATQMTGTRTDANTAQGATASTYVTPTNAVTSSAALVWGLPGVIVYSGGVTVGSDTAGIQTPYVLCSSLNPGQTGTGTAFLNGWVVLLYWDKNVLSPAQQQIFANGVTP